MLIYRGVCKTLDIKNSGLIKPKGSDETYEFYAGSTDFMAGNPLNTIVPSRRNAQHAHNICSDHYKSSFVSFTTSEAIAQKFATSDKIEEGWVYVCEIEQLIAAGIPVETNIEAQVNNHEEEVLINLFGYQHLPKNLILKKYQVL